MYLARTLFSMAHAGKKGCAPLISVAILKASITYFLLTSMLSFFSKYMSKAGNTDKKAGCEDDVRFFRCGIGFLHQK